MLLRKAIKVKESWDELLGKCLLHWQSQQILMAQSKESGKVGEEQKNLVSVSA